MPEQEQRLAFAVQKSSGGGSGRLTGETVELLKGCDLKFYMTDKLDSTPVTNFPLDILSVRSRDIPPLLAKGMADLGIVGLDIITETESEAPLIRLMPLGYGRCKLALGVREDVQYKQPSDLRDSKIATTYPNITTRYFQSKEVPINLLVLNGSVELAGYREWVRGVVDIIESGASMLTNGLDPKEIILESQAWLVANPELRIKKGSEKTVEEILTRSLAYLRPKLNRYIVVNAPVRALDVIKGLIPGSFSPTVSPCVDPEWVDISSVVPFDNFWQITRDLKTAGARDIIEIEMKRMIPNGEDLEIEQMMAKIYT